MRSDPTRPPRLLWALAVLRAYSRIGFDLGRSLLAPVCREDDLAEDQRPRVQTMSPEQPAERAHRGDAITLLSWNIHRNYDPRGVRTGLEHLLDRHRPEVLLLQEVPVYPEAPLWELDGIRQLLRDRHLCYAPVHRVRRQSLYYPFVHSGLLTASSLPTAEASLVELPTVSRPKLGRHHLVKRIALHTRHHAGNQALSVINLHLENTTGPGGRMRQVQRVLEAASDSERMTALGGDFNTVLGRLERVWQEIIDSGFCHAHPASRPRMLPRLDHFFVRGALVVDAQSLPVRGSDHRPLLVRVGLAGDRGE